MIHMALSSLLGKVGDLSEWNKHLISFIFCYRILITKLTCKNCPLILKYNVLQPSSVRCSVKLLIMTSCSWYIAWFLKARGAPIPFLETVMLLGWHIDQQRQLFVELHSLLKSTIKLEVTALNYNEDMHFLCWGWANSNC